MGLGEKRGGVIVTGKRKRNKVDYVAMNARLNGKTLSGGGSSAQSAPGTRQAQPSIPVTSTGLDALLADSDAAKAIRENEDKDHDVDGTTLIGEDDLRNADAVAEAARELGSCASAEHLARLRQLQRYEMDIATLQSSGVRLCSFLQ